VWATKVSTKGNEMENFAKVFDDAEIGQAVVLAKANDDAEPEVRFFFQKEGFGICECALSFTDDDDGWDKRDKAFNEMDIAMVRYMHKRMFDGLPIEQ
jgi:hypothetical protein